MVSVRMRKLVSITLCAFLIATVVAFPPKKAQAAPTWTITAYGNGHGLGMSQNGAKGMADAGRSYSDIITTYYKNTTIAKGYGGAFSSQPAFEVAITTARQSTWTVTSPSTTMIVATKNGSVTVPKGTYNLVFSGGSVTVKNASTSASFGPYATGGGNVDVYASTGPIVLGNASGSLSKANVAYEGKFVFYGSGASYNVKNRLPIETYLYGVVPREMPASWHSNALKAQAIAARSYAIANGYTAAKAPKVVAPTESFQVYNGYGYMSGTTITPHDNATYRPRVLDAVNQTAGSVGVCNGSVITAYFSADAGGYTENSENVWSSALPYIKGIKEPNPIIGSKTKTFTSTDLVKAANSVWGSKVPLDTNLTGFSVSKKGVARPIELTFTSSNRGKIVVNGNSSISTFLRSKLGFSSTLIAITTNNATSGKTSRLAGTNRCETAVKISQAGFASSNEVIIASGELPYDALVASGLAGVLNGGKGAPILFVDPTSVPEVTKAEIKRLKATKLYVIGGTGPISAATFTQLKGLVGSTERIAGIDRYETAEAVNQKMRTIGGSSAGTRVIVFNGDTGAPDAVCAAGLAYSKRIAMVPVKAEAIPASSKWTLNALAPTQSLVIGGTGAVSTQVRAKLPAAKSIAMGTTRFQTAVMVADYAVRNEGFSYGATCVAGAEGLPDALASGPFVGARKGVLLYTYQNEAAKQTNVVLSANKATIKNLYILGGTGPVSQALEKQLDASLL